MTARPAGAGRIGAARIGLAPILAPILVLTAATPLSARMTLEGTSGPIVLHDGATVVENLVPAREMGAFETDTLQAFEQAAADTGFFGSLVIDRTAADRAFFQIGLHDPSVARTLSLLLCAEGAADAADCIEAARAVPEGFNEVPRGAGQTLSRAAVPLFLELAGSGSSKGVVSVALSGLGHVAVSAPARDKATAEAQALSFCEGFVEAGLADYSAALRDDIEALEISGCTTVFTR